MEVKDTNLAVANQHQTDSGSGANNVNYHAIFEEEMSQQSQTLTTLKAKSLEHLN